MLDVLGLEPDDECIYRALLGRPNATAILLSDLLAVAQADVDKALSRLIEWELVIRSAGEQFTAAPPAMALGALISQRRDRLRMAEQALVTFAEEHRAAMTGRSINDLIEVVTGIDAIRHRFLQVQQAARMQVRTFITAPFVAVPPDENTAEPAAIGRGVQFRAVLDRAVLAEPGIIADAIESLRNGVHLRVADQLPMKLVLADADLGLVPLAVTPAGEPGAVLLHRSGLLDALDALFETVWSTRPPARAVRHRRRSRDHLRTRRARPDRPRPKNPHTAAGRPDRSDGLDTAGCVPAHAAAPHTPHGHSRSPDPDAVGRLRHPTRMGRAAVSGCPPASAYPRRGTTAYPTPPRWCTGECLPSLRCCKHMRHAV